MSKLLRYLMQNRLQNKFIFAFIIFLLIPMLIVFIVATSYYQSLLKGKISQAIQDNFSQISYSIEIVLNDMINAAYVISEDEEIKDVLEAYDSQNAQIVKDIGKVNKSLMKVNNTILLKYNSPFIILYDFNDRVFNIPNRQVNIDKNKMMDYFKNSQSPYIWFSSYDKLIKYLTYDDEDGQRITIASRFTNLNYLSDYVICISLKSNDIFNNIEAYNSKFGSDLYIIDSKGNVISSNNYINGTNKDNWTFNTLLSGKKQGTMTFTLDKSKYIVNYYSIKKTDWKIIQIVSFEELFKELASTRNIGISFIIVFFIVLIVLIVFITLSFIKPLKNVVESMEKVRTGNLEEEIKIKSQDEVGILAAAFNNMLKEIKNLISENSKQQAILRNSELKALQAQINPHFLYNALDTIHWDAEMSGNKKISQMSLALSIYFKKALNDGKESITVYEEIIHAKSYLDIQKMRYEDKFDFFFNVDEKIMNCIIIKLILQPLIENSIYHGIKLKKGRGNIVVSGEVKNNYIIFKVIDNGAGIEEPRLTELNNFLKDYKKYKYYEHTYGIKNVNERIKLTYGNDYGIIYYSKKNEYTIAEIKLPVQYESEVTNYV